MKESAPYLPDESHGHPPAVTERPKVFEGETEEESLRAWDPVFQFAREYYRKLRKDIPLADHPETVNELVRSVQDEVYDRTAMYIPEVLKDTAWSGSEEKFTEAVTGRNYSSIDLKDAAMTKTTLGLSLVSERACAATMSEALKGLAPEDLERFGMDTDVRDIIADAIPRLTASNAEYVRLWARALGGEGRENRPIDAVREHARMNSALEDMKTRFAESAWLKDFGDTGEEFLGYLDTLQGAYRPFNKEGEAYSAVYRDRLVKETYDLFLDFYKAHPEFPLILMPQSGSMLSDDVEVKNLGFDPEIRIVWQTARERGISATVEGLRGDFSDALGKSFPDLIKKEDLAVIAESRAIVGNDLAALGINMKFRGVAQDGEDRNWNLLIENAQWREYTKPAMEKIKKLVPAELREVVEDRSFGDLMNMLSFFHEFVHRIYSDESKSAKRLGDLNDTFAESKSDTLARIVFTKVMQKEARQRFGDQAQEAMNLAMLGDDLVNYYDGNPDGEDYPYWLGASARLGVLAEKNVFIKTGDAVSIDEFKLREDWGAYMMPLGRELLQMYASAESDLKEAKNIAARLDTPSDALMLKDLGEHLARRG
ncbi:MAG: hypothetical protein AAB417_03035 [Patescibacteria group bacterium]